MPLGPGKYNDACSAARLLTEAHGCLLIVINGNRGHGFSIQMTPQLMAHGNVSTMLRAMADEIDQSVREDFENNRKGRHL